VLLNSLFDQVTVVMVTYNSADCVAQLASTLAQFKHVVISDNASRDDTCATVARLLPHAQLLANKVNLGFGAANNRAFASANTPFVLIVNPDCAFTAQDILPLYEAAQAHPKAAMVGPEIVNASGKPEMSYHLPSVPFGFSVNAPKHPALGLTSVGFLTGACILARREALLQVKGFDEAFFLYYEDEDLCLRLWQAGHEILVQPSARVTHFSRRSSKSASPFNAERWRGRHHTQSKLLFARKHHGAKVASKLKRTLWLSTLVLVLPGRLLVPIPKYLGRVVGRIQGLWQGS
jgi:N-acetylglucosaminyl-diphospho-decaprenol L-rhamnosyltransferase